ncbi:putative transcription factor C2H2 family [Dioscorea sansibarensis]
MESRPESSETQRNKCAACFKQYNRMEHLVEHMRISFHSAHEPKCGICQKHCRSFESLREHLVGKPRSKKLKMELSEYSPWLIIISTLFLLFKDHCQRLNVQRFSASEGATYA